MRAQPRLARAAFPDSNSMAPSTTASATVLSTKSARKPHTLSPPASPKTHHFLSASLIAAAAVGRVPSWCFMLHLNRPAQSSWGAAIVLGGGRRETRCKKAKKKWPSSTQLASL